MSGARCHHRFVTDRILSPRARNRALLARQLLLERSALSIADAIEQVGGFQTQYAPSGHVGLWTRLRDMQRDGLTAALPEAFRPRVFSTRSPFSVGTYLVDDVVAGAWSTPRGHTVLRRSAGGRAADHRSEDGR